MWNWNDLKIVFPSVFSSVFNIFHKISHLNELVLLNYELTYSQQMQRKKKRIKMKRRRRKKRLTWCTASRWAAGKCSSATRRPYNGPCPRRDAFASGPATKGADTERNKQKSTFRELFNRVHPPSKSWKPENKISYQKFLYRLHQIASEVVSMNSKNRWHFIESLYYYVS